MIVVLYILWLAACAMMALLLWGLAFVLAALWWIAKAIFYASAVFVGRRRARRRLEQPPAINADVPT